MENKFAIGDIVYIIQTTPWIERFYSKENPLLISSIKYNYATGRTNYDLTYDMTESSYYKNISEENVFGTIEELRREILIRNNNL